MFSIPAHTFGCWNDGQDRQSGVTGKDYLLQNEKFWRGIMCSGHKLLIFKSNDFAFLAAKSVAPVVHKIFLLLYKIIVSNNSFSFTKCCSRWYRFISVISIVECFYHLIFGWLPKAIHGCIKLKCILRSSRIVQANIALFLIGIGMINAL